jgi:hypothetical protein
MAQIRQGIEKRNFNRNHDKVKLIVNKNIRLDRNILLHY